MVDQSAASEHRLDGPRQSAVSAGDEHVEHVIVSGDRDETTEADQPRRSEGSAGDSASGSNENDVAIAEAQAEAVTEIAAIEAAANVEMAEIAVLNSAEENDQWQEVHARLARTEEQLTEMSMKLETLILQPLTETSTEKEPSSSEEATKEPTTEEITDLERFPTVEAENAVETEHQEKPEEHRAERKLRQWI